MPGALAAALELAAAPGGNFRPVGASGGKLVELVSRHLVIGTAVGWEPRSCLQVRTMATAILQVEIAWAVAHAAGRSEFVVDKQVDVASSSGSWLQCDLAGCSNNRLCCLLLLPCVHAPLLGLYLP